MEIEIIGLLPDIY